MSLIKINDVDGNLLYEGNAKSRKEYIQSLVLKGRSLARADFAGQDLTHLNLDEGIFDGANFDGADLRGTRAKKGNFSRASMRGVIAMGFQAKGGNFFGANFSNHPDHGTPSRFDGAIMQSARFDKAIFSGAFFVWAGLSSSTFTGAVIEKTDFSKSYLHNVDFVNSTIQKCNFAGADMTPTTRIPDAHLPNRTAGATIRNNRYGSTKIGKGNDLFRRDSLLTRLTPIAMSGTAALALAASWTVLPEHYISLESIREFVGDNTWGFIGVASAVIISKDAIEEKFKEWVADMGSDVTEKVRAATQNLVSRGKALKNLSIAVVTGQATDALQRAMRDVDAPVLATIKANVTGEVDVLVVDRKNLAAALRTLSDTISSRHASDQDLVISRVKDHEVGGNIPSAIIIRKDGDIEAVWDQGDGKFTEMKWDSAGFPITEDATVHGPHVGHIATIKKFIDAALRDCEVLNFDFDPSSHTVRAGRDSSLVVLDQASGRVDNPYGPAVLTLKGEAFYYRQGGETDSKFKRKPKAPVLMKEHEEQEYTGPRF